MPETLETPSPERIQTFDERRIAAWIGKAVFVTGHDQTWDVYCTQNWNRIRTVSHASLNCGNVFRAHFSHHFQSTLNQVRAIFARSLSHEFRN